MQLAINNFKNFNFINAIKETSIVTVGSKTSAVQVLFVHKVHASISICTKLTDHSGTASF